MQSRLLSNNWFGKAVGATCAWIWAPNDAAWLAVALIAGIALGHLYDQWASGFGHDDQAGLDRLADGHAAGSTHLTFLFAALGRVAKASGSVTTEHIAYTQRLMRHMALPPAAQAQAKRWFKEGKSPSYPLQQLSRECLQPAADGGATRLTILRCLCVAASIRTNDQALASLKQLGGYLGFAPSRIAREFGAVHQPDSGANGARQAAGPPPAGAHGAALERAFDCLKIQPGASRASVKLAYRKQISRHHPDKLPRNASASARQRAQARMVELREALDLIQAQDP